MYNVLILPNKHQSINQLTNDKNIEQRKAKKSKKETLEKGISLFGDIQKEIPTMFFFFFLRERGVCVC